jgi:hypothetical protein
MAIYFPPEQRTNTGLITQLLSMFLGGMANKQAGIDQAAASKALEGIVAPNTGTNLSLNDMPMKAPSLNLSSPSLSGVPSSAVGGMYGGSPLSMSGMPAAPPAAPDTGWTSTPTSTPASRQDILSRMVQGGNFDVLRKSPEAMAYLDQMIKGPTTDIQLFQQNLEAYKKMMDINAGEKPPQKVSPNETLVDPVTHKPIYTAPPAEESQYNKDVLKLQQQKDDNAKTLLDIQEQRQTLNEQMAGTKDANDQTKLALEDKKLDMQSKHYNTENKRLEALITGTGKVSAFKEKVNLIEGKLGKPLTAQQLIDLTNSTLTLPDESIDTPEAKSGFWNKVKGLFSKKSAPAGQSAQPAGNYKVGETRVINGVTVTRQSNGQWL